MYALIANQHTIRQCVARQLSLRRLECESQIVSPCNVIRPGEDAQMLGSVYGVTAQGAIWIAQTLYGEVIVCERKRQTRKIIIEPHTKIAVCRISCEIIEPFHDIHKA